MRKLTLFLAFIILPQFVCAGTPGQPNSLKLSEKQEAVLKTEFPDFTPWTLADYGNSVKYYPFTKLQQPYAISWDFNGKKNPAAVITGHDAENNYIVIIKPEKYGYKIIKWFVGFINKPYTPKTVPVLRLLKEGSIVRVKNTNDPIVIKDLWHSGFVYMDVWVSTAIPPAEDFKLNGDNSINYYHEGLFQLERASINSRNKGISVPLNDKYLKDVSPTVEMKKAISKFNKDFKIWSSTNYQQTEISNYPYSEESVPYAIKHDLNGDGVEDMIVAGHDNNANMVLELISGTSGYYVRNIGDSEPCYSKAQERKGTLDLRPSHLLALYKNGVDYAGVHSEAIDKFWNYNPNVLIGIRMLNTCVEAQKPGTGQGETVASPEYGDWQPWPSKEKEKAFIYGEKIDSIVCPSGIDHCGFELFPPVL